MPMRNEQFDRYALKSNGIGGEYHQSVAQYVSNPRVLVKRNEINSGKMVTPQKIDAHGDRLAGEAQLQADLPSTGTGAKQLDYSFFCMSICLFTIVLFL